MHGECINLLTTHKCKCDRGYRDANIFVEKPDFKGTGISLTSYKKLIKSHLLYRVFRIIKYMTYTLVSLKGPCVDINECWDMALVPKEARIRENSLDVQVKVMDL